MTHGQCRHCMRRREVFRCQRRGAGAYNRAPRWYWSSICAECATSLFAYVSSSGSMSTSGWSNSGLADAAATTEEGAVLVADWRARKAELREARHD